MKTWLKILLLVLSAAALVVCVLCCLYIWQYVSGGRFHDQLRESAVADGPVAQVVETEPPAADGEDAVSQTPEEEEDTLRQMTIQIDFDALAQVNSDIYAWIEVPGTVISYAVVQHPQDELFYNTHNVDKSYYTGGSIFSQTYNRKDFTDPMTVLYGHNLQSSRMFTQLNDFADGDFFEENRYIYIYTPEKVFQYEIFAAYPHSSEHLLLCHDFSDPEVFNAYFASVREEGLVNANFKDALFPEAGDRVLTLSTCYRQNRLQRYLVQGVLVEEYDVVEG